MATIRASAVYSTVSASGSLGVGRGLDPERPPREVDLDHGLQPAVGAEPLGLLPHQVHQVGAEDPLGEAGEVLDGGRPGQLAARLPALEDHGAQVGPGRVEGGGQARGPRADDDHGGMRHRSLVARPGRESSGETRRPPPDLEHDAVDRAVSCCQKIGAGVQQSTARPAPKSRARRERSAHRADRATADATGTTWRRSAAARIVELGTAAGGRT